jgi:AraC family transcriptional regulator
MDGISAGTLATIRNTAARAGEAAAGRGLSRRALMRACSYMEANLGERLSLRDIAGAACVSRSHFARMFRVSTGHSVIAYLYRLRIERAKAVLIAGEVALADLAVALGFSHQSHFTRVFRRHAGMTPCAFSHIYGEDWPSPKPAFQPNGGDGANWSSPLSSTKEHARINSHPSVQAATPPGA